MATSALVLRSQQSTPLSNSQLDGNFTYLNDRLASKYDVADFTAENISTALNTPALLSAGGTQTKTALCTSNALDALTIDGVLSSSLVPTTGSKISIPVRTTDGYLHADKFVGPLEGNATTATSATTANIALALSNTYTVPIERGGTGSNNAVDARTALQVLHTGGGNSMTEKLQLKTSSPSNASINFGQGTAPSNVYLSNGDMWIQQDGVYYRADSTTYKVAATSSPTFTGQPKAPDASGVSSQVATISHIADAVSTLNDSIDLKANINSPNFTGTPQADTASQTVIDRRIATTQYVHTAVNNKADTITDAYETYTDNSISTLQQAINNALNLKANLDSPYFTGTPTAVTPTYPNDSQRIATTAYIKTAIDSVNQALASAVNNLTALINDTRPVPTGSVFYIASSSVPNGYLQAAGQAVSKLTYPTLWAALGSPATTVGDAANTFRLPDLRGEFIRGWDNGRGIDTNRSLMSYQEDQIERHKHVAPYAEAFGAPFGQTSSTGYQGSGRTDYDNYLYFTNDGSDYNGVVNTAGVMGTETRPRNVALMPIIKY